MRVVSLEQAEKAADRSFGTRLKNLERKLDQLSKRLSVLEAQYSIPIAQVVEVKKPEKVKGVKDAKSLRKVREKGRQGKDDKAQ